MTEWNPDPKGGRSLTAPFRSEGERRRTDKKGCFPGRSGAAYFSLLRIGPLLPSPKETLLHEEFGSLLSL